MTLKEVNEGSKIVIKKIKLSHEMLGRLRCFFIEEKSVLNVIVNTFNGIIVETQGGYYVIGNRIAKSIEVEND